MGIIYYATSNKHKVREVQHCLGSPSWLQFFDCKVLEMMTTDLEALVLAKALSAYRELRHPLIVEHGGLFIDALGGLPGTLEQPFWERLSDKICEIMPSGASRAAQARSALCYCDGRRRLVFSAVVEGELAPSPRGSEGFHWDPIFIPKGERRTFAEMTLDEKLARSPTAQGYVAFRKALPEL